MSRRSGSIGTGSICTRRRRRWFRRFESCNNLLGLKALLKLEEKVQTCVNQYKAGHWIDSTRLASDHFCEITERGSVQYSRRTPYSSNNTQLPNGSMQALTSSYSAISSVLSSMRVGGRRSAIMICVGEWLLSVKQWETNNSAALTRLNCIRI
jgi:hypothetical protein